MSPASRVANRPSKAPVAKKKPKLVAGWIETIDLPDLRVFGLNAKLDTGAKSSALHVDNLVMIGGRCVRFDVVIEMPGKRKVRHVEAPVSRRGRVRSSNGEYTTRVFITTRMRLGELERTIELSLVDRGRMLHRMLVGRTSLKGVLVDASRRHVLDRE
ncbi:MAG: RimK/LysX family protein [Myxococcales bacterium]|nr:RimK/LysX family protein [Myxococcales bacterium]